MTAIEVQHFDPNLHGAATQSRKCLCAWGGEDTCHTPAEFSVRGRGGSYAKCAEHIVGFVRSEIRD
jgi:hypothetical protein